MQLHINLHVADKGPSCKSGREKLFFTKNHWWTEYWNLDSDTYLAILLLSFRNLDN